MRPSPLIPNISTTFQIANLFYKMERKQAFDWIRTELQEKAIFLTESAQLSQGFHFLQIVHKFHPKAIDLSQGYTRSDANQYMILQNFKLLSRAFVKLGWKKIEPDRFIKQNEKDYMNLACFLWKTLTTHTLNYEQPRLNNDAKQEESSPTKSIKVKNNPSSKLVQLQRKKSHLLSLLGLVQDTLKEKADPELGQFQKIKDLKIKLTVILESGFIDKQKPT